MSKVTLDQDIVEWINRSLTNGEISTVAADELLSIGGTVYVLTETWGRNYELGNSKWLERLNSPKQSCYISIQDISKYSNIESISPSYIPGLEEACEAGSKASTEYTGQMSTYRVILLHCDGRDCDEEIGLSLEEGTPMNHAKDAVKSEAERHDWVINDGGAPSDETFYCPRCAKIADCPNCGPSEVL